MDARYRAMPLPMRAALWFTIAGVTLKVVATITTPIFTRLMSTEQFGLVSVYNSWLAVLAVATTLRLSAAVFNKGMSKYPEGREAFTVTMQTITTVLVLLLGVLYLVFSTWANSVTGLSTLISVALLAELLMTPAVTFWAQRERYDFNYRSVVTVTLVMSVGAAILGVVAVLAAEDKATARILAGSVVQVAVGAVLYVWNLKRAGTPFVPEYARFAIGFNAPLVPHYLSMYALDQLDRIMIAKLIGLSAAGVYSVGYTVGLAIRVATDSLSSALIPWQYRRLEEGHLATVERRLTQVLVFYSILVLLFIAIAPEFVAILGGSKYAGATYVVPPVAVATYFIFIYTVLGNVEIYYDSNVMMVYGSVIAAVVNVLLNVMFIPRYGYVAAAYTTLACYAGLASAHFLYARKVVAARTDGGRVISGKTLLRLSAVLIGLSAVLVATYPYPLIRLGAVLLLGAGLYIKGDAIQGLLARDQR